MKTLLPLLLCFAPLNCLNKTPQDFELLTQQATFNDMHLNSMTAYFGISSKHSKLQTNFDLQINQSFVLVGKRSSVDWGIQCTSEKEDTTTTCQYDSVISPRSSP